jgi:hypothetical protein
MCPSLHLGTGSFKVGYCSFFFFEQIKTSSLHRTYRDAFQFVSVYFVRIFLPGWPTKDTYIFILRTRFLIYEEGILFSCAIVRIDLYRPKMPGFGVDRPRVNVVRSFVLSAFAKSAKSDC